MFMGLSNIAATQVCLVTNDCGFMAVIVRKTSLISSLVAEAVQVPTDVLCAVVTVVTRQGLVTRAFVYGC